MNKSITEVTRRSIVDHIMAEDINWAGRLPEDEFLSRLYDLTVLPSTDYRMHSADADIRQHRVHWNDWENDWVFYDSRFNLIRSSDEAFLQFLCETVHPVVRPDSQEARRLASAYNRHLAADGWQLVESSQISGRPVFRPQQGDLREEVFSDPTGWQKVDRQFQEVRLRLDEAETEEQFQAVGLLCRETLITIAEEVYSLERHKSSDGLEPSGTDAKRMLEAIFETEMAGGTNEEARAHAKAAVRLALALQHKRTADFRTAALCAEATASVVNMLAVLTGRRGRRP